jgi:hypothetical protein
MAQQKNTRLEKHQLDAISDMVDRGVADNESEAHRMLLNAGKREYGYKNGGHADTLLKRGLSKIGVLLALTGIIGLAFTFAYPVPARVPSFSVLIVGAGMYAGSGVLEEYEPDVSRKLKQMVGGESA